MEKYRPKYSPPETLNNSSMMDLKNDIWSFGCILIDIFSKENPIYRINISKKEIMQSKKFPVIPNDITGLTRDIISRCLDTNYETRINIIELDNIMNVFFDNSLKSNNQELTKRLSKKNDNLSK